jgi:flagellar protein FliS
MGATGPLAEYERTQILTAPPAGLAAMLCDRLLALCEDAKLSIAENRTEDANGALVRAQNIVAELQSGLNFEAGDIARNLNSLYDFAYRRLVAANVSKEPTPIADVERIARGLKEAWESVLESEAPRREPLDPSRGQEDLDCA